MRSGAGIGSNFLIKLRLGFPVTRIGPVTLMPMKFVSMRQISLVVFVFSFTPLLGNFLCICTLL